MVAVAAWRHVHDLFAQAGVTNVTWVWSPKVSDRPLGGLYPGDAYVDWVGVDGYNWGTTASWSSWQTPSQVFGTTLANLRRVSSRPIVVSETASTEVGGNKAQWIQQFYSMLGANPDIRAFVWFNFNKETDGASRARAGPAPLSRRVSPIPGTGPPEPGPPA